jgi:predicted transcriptional regulator
VQKNKLKAKIVEQGLRASDVAGLLGITPTSFSLKMNGHRDFNLGEIQMLMKVLELDTWDLMTIFFADDGAGMVT